MKLFLFPFCSFNRCLISSLHRWEGEKLSFEIWTQTKNFPLSHCARCKDFINKIFCDINDKITYIPVSLGVNSLSAWTCESISLGCLPVLKIICTDKTGEDSGEKHLRQWFVHTALTITSAAMPSLIFFFPSQFSLFLLAEGAFYRKESISATFTSGLVGLPSHLYKRHTWELDTDCGPRTIRHPFLSSHFKPPLLLILSRYTKPCSCFIALMLSPESLN